MKERKWGQHFFHKYSYALCQGDTKECAASRELTKNNGSLEKTGRSKTRETTQDYNGPVRQAESKHHDKSYETHYRFEVEK